ncbi:Histidine phosphatase superfamily (branch 1) [Shimia gijangensis]|uniref:Histidine phosphatase superfamily (Branch 1) n=1 Tax=Shimia gijangensis TaxID=1470563 RepID=A0A1M6GWT0_9RHOB|nr:histidine phosphatase family protein [Shimia gijangensis]SHJ14360.1 Histidine phosphatase superfamily (branch 1) [Shimia gijangensis]
MTRFRLLLLAALSVTLLACSSVTVPNNARTTIIALRHADRDGTELNAKGRARSAALPAALEGYDIDAIFAPDIQRNLDTAAPLSKATGLPVTQIITDNAAGQMTTAYPNGTVVWVGNKDNLKALWKDLGASGEPPLKYGDLFVVELKSLGRRSVTHLSFGE